MKDIYVHTSNFEYTRELKDSNCFRRIYEYGSRHPLDNNEYGFIKTDNLRIHFIIGSIPSKECPWCGCDPIVKMQDSNITSFTELPTVCFYVECPNCFSRGPIFKTLKYKLIDDAILENINFFVLSRFSQRLPWDHKLKKHFEDPGEDESDE